MNSYSRRERELSRLATEEGGVLDLAELRRCGLTQQGVDRRHRVGRLCRIHDGVYAVGHMSLTLEQRFIAASKACGPSGALSHRSNAARLKIHEWVEQDIEITVPSDVTRAHPGIKVHRSALMKRGDQMIRDGLLVTNAAWTVVALAAVLPEPELRSAVREALNLKIVSIPGILRLLDRLGPVRGARTLRKILTHALPTRSELEEVVLTLIISAGFETPEVNQPLRLEGRRVIPDFRWPKQRLVVEADGARWHDGALARADDLERQRLLERHGETVLRVRWDQAVSHASTTARRIAAAGAPATSARGGIPSQNE